MTAMTEKKDYFTYTLLLGLHLVHQAFKETVTSLSSLASFLPIDAMNASIEVTRSISDLSPVLAQANESSQAALSTMHEILPVASTAVATHSSSISTYIQAATTQSGASNTISIVPGDFSPSKEPWQTISINQAGLIVALFALMIHKYSNRDVESTLNNNKPAYVS